MSNYTPPKPELIEGKVESAEEEEAAPATTTLDLVRALVSDFATVSAEGVATMKMTGLTMRFNKVGVDLNAPTDDDFAEAVAASIYEFKEDTDELMDELQKDVKESRQRAKESMKKAVAATKKRKEVSGGAAATVAAAAAGVARVVAPPAPPLDLKVASFTFSSSASQKTSKKVKLNDLEAVAAKAMSGGDVSGSVTKWHKAMAKVMKKQ